MARLVRRTLRCTPVEKAAIRERAEAAGMPVSHFIVACALHENAGGPPREKPRLVLSEEEQRALHDGVARMDAVHRALHEALPGTDLSLFGAIAFIQRELWARRPDGRDR
ncbi:MAG: hypothetical protein OXH14_12795 [Alphaproteobacteria bacterium]|nr:hypothetical protein [Alphaproteobacteria bacterium]